MAGMSQFQSLVFVLMCLSLFPFMSVVFDFIAFVFESLENLAYVELFHLSSRLLGRDREPYLRGPFARKIWL